MFQEIEVNQTKLPRPDNDLTFQSQKVQQSFESEAGTTLLNITRPSKLTIKGNWTITGKWLKQFRDWQLMNQVTVSCFYPSEVELSHHICEFIIEEERHIRFSRDLLSVNGIYQVSVRMEEL